MRALLQKRIILIVCTAAMLIAAVFAVRVTRTVLGNMKIILPEWIEWANENISNDEVNVSISNKKIEVNCSDGSKWSLTNKYKVQDALLYDVDNDFKDELLILCWKRGKYGEHRPSWVTRDELLWSQHVYIYEFTKDGIRPKWMASEIGVDVKDWYNEKDIQVLENLEDEKSYWKWISWGLERVK